VASAMPLIKTPVLPKKKRERKMWRLTINSEDTISYTTILTVAILSLKILKIIILKD
jgi:hypothetical protein